MNRWKVVSRSDKRRCFCRSIFLQFSWLRRKAALDLSRLSWFLPVLVPAAGRAGCFHVAAGRRAGRANNSAGPWQRPTAPAFSCLNWPEK